MNVLLKFFITGHDNLGWYVGDVRIIAHFCHNLNYLERYDVESLWNIRHSRISSRRSIGAARAELFVNVEVEAEEENDGDHEGDERQEDELLAESRLLKLDSELVLFLSERVSFTLKQRLSNAFQIEIHFTFFFLIKKL